MKQNQTDYYCALQEPHFIFLLRISIRIFEMQISILVEIRFFQEILVNSTRLEGENYRKYHLYFGCFLIANGPSPAVKVQRSSFLLVRITQFFCNTKEP